MKVNILYILLCIFLLTTVVSAATPVANFYTNVTYGAASAAVSFTDSSTNSPTGWSWAFKNATVGWTQFSTSQNPSYSFAAGVYDINLTASNGDGSDAEIKISHLTIYKGLASSTFLTYYPWTPESITRVLPFGSAPSVSSGSTLSISAAQTQFEDTSFVFRSNHNDTSIFITPSTLSDGSGHTIPASNIDIRWVKVWYQAMIPGNEDTWTDNVTTRELYPELLLKNDSLIFVNYTSTDNYLWVTHSGGAQDYMRISRDTDVINTTDTWDDATSLVALKNITTNENKQVWVTVYVPESQTGGNYTGVLVVSNSTSTIGLLTLNVEVLPYKLGDPVGIYGLFYKGIVEHGSFGIESELKTNASYLRDLANMKNHSVIYAGMNDNYYGYHYEEALQLRAASGIKNDTLYLHNDDIRPILSSDSSSIDAVISRLVDFQSDASANGFQKVVIYGIDEASSANLILERPSMASIRLNGSPIFAAVSGNLDAVTVAGDLIDTCVFSNKNAPGRDNATHINLWHALNHNITSYNDPQGGVENATVYRHNYGLRNYYTGYNGMFDWVYQGHFSGDNWNDWDGISSTHYRDETLTYSTANGVIDTIQYEGMREGIDDMRYVAYLNSLSGSNSSSRSIIGSGITAGDTMREIREDLIAEIASYSGSSPSAGFTANVTSGDAVLSVGFTDTSTNSPTSWVWSYENDTIGWTQFSTSQNPSYAFANGTYDIKLVATNTYGSDTETKTDYIVSTSTSPPEDPDPDPEPMGSSGDPPGEFWYLANSSAFGDSGVKGGHAIVFQNKIFYVTDNGTVYSSPNGFVWNVENASIPGLNFSGTFGLSTINGDLYIYQKYDYYNGTVPNDIYGSHDGRIWTLINSSTPFGERIDGCGIAFKGKLYEINGVDWMGTGLTFDDSLSSSNANFWSTDNTSTFVDGRARASCAIYNDKIWLTGGFNDSMTIYHDVYYTSDGNIWTLANSSLLPEQGGVTVTSVGNELVASSNKLFLITGQYNDTIGQNYLLVMSSSDGAIWETVNDTPLTYGIIPYIEDYSTVVFNNSLWIIGGNNGTASRSEVWYSPLDLPPITDFTGSVVTGAPPLTVSFVNNSTGFHGTTGYTWYFGEENYTGAWSATNMSSGWGIRDLPALVALNDGSLVLMGGEYTGPGSAYYNDTWRSVDNGSTWTRINSSGGWVTGAKWTAAALSDNTIVLIDPLNSVSDYDVWSSTDKGYTWDAVNKTSGLGNRAGQAIAVLSDDTIVITGGYAVGTTYMNDTWISTNKGYSWTRVNASGGWGKREWHGMVATSNNSLVLVGGYGPGGDDNWLYNDTWISTDRGYTWSLVNNDNGWFGRDTARFVAMPDNTILMTGGYIYDVSVGDVTNETWITKDYGVTWNLTNTSAGWEYRYYHAMAAARTGDIFIAGGFDGISYFNDTWKFNPSSSSLQAPSHVYSDNGTYSVALKMFDISNANSTVKINYINVSPISGDSPIALFSATPTSGYIPLDVVFTDLSLNTPTSWNWSFGDGNYSNSQHVNYTYNSSGTFTVILNVSNTFGFSNYSINISVGSGYPVASFITDTTYGPSPLPVQFTDTSTTTGLTTYYWEFGDGNTSTEENPLYAYLSDGNYNARLTVTDTVGVDTSDVTVIHVSSSLNPFVNFGANRTNFYSSPASVQFTDLTTNIISSMSSWNWSFGDGTYSETQNPVHTYALDGQYDVRLTIINDSHSNYTVKYGYININMYGLDGTGGVVYVNFTASPLSGPIPLNVSFTDRSVCNPVCSAWSWDFNGDGAIDSVGRNPTYTYTYPGNYSPRLIVSNGLNSGSKIRINYIAAGTLYVPTTIPQPTQSWRPGYNGTIFNINGGNSMDMPNSTYLKYWLQNFTSTGNFSIYGFSLGILAPIMHVFGFWIFLIIWMLYLAAVWIRSQDVTLPLVIGILSIGTFGLLFPKESFVVIVIMFAICGGVILYKAYKE